MNRRSAILTTVLGWLVWIFGSKKTKANVIPVKTEVPDIADVRHVSNRTDGWLSYLDMTITNANDNAESVKYCIDCMRNQGWHLYSMKGNDICPSSSDVYHITFYRPVTQADLAEWKKRLAAECEPTFEDGCRWCGAAASARQVPTNAPTSDYYCYSPECVRKCRNYYSF